MVEVPDSPTPFICVTGTPYANPGYFVVAEAVTVTEQGSSFTTAIADLFCLIYTMNFAYPESKFSRIKTNHIYSFIQQVLLELDPSGNLAQPVLTLKNII